mmetsp:Transcript_17421/g.38121  ORF Transcript_17421/g.38121 Transcript_17421/m.38121 type:complete len:208 (+) Transcript_17421:1162-1785(+)
MLKVLSASPFIGLIDSLARGVPAIGHHQYTWVVHVSLDDFVALDFVADVGLHSENELLLHVLEEPENHGEHRHEVTAACLRLLVGLQNIHLQTVRHLAQRVDGDAGQYHRSQSLVEDMRDSLQQGSQSLLWLPQLEVSLKALALKVRDVKDVGASLSSCRSELANFQLAVEHRLEVRRHRRRDKAGSQMHVEGLEFLQRRQICLVDI